MFFENIASISRGSSLHSFSDDGVGGGSDSRVPFFTADITLAIPNVVSLSTDCYYETYFGKVVLSLIFCKVKFN